MAIRVGVFVLAYTLFLGLSFALLIGLLSLNPNAPENPDHSSLFSMGPIFYLWPIVPAGLIAAWLGQVWDKGQPGGTKP
jgi:hypothetical protein